MCLVDSMDYDPEGGSVNLESPFAHFQNKRLRDVVKAVASDRLGL